MSQKKILVLGATGAMGKHLVPKLAERGWLVDAVAIDECPYRHPNVRALTGNAKDFAYRTELLRNNYDGIVDFMIYTTAELVLYLPEIVAAAGHYIFLSSYRVYDGCEVPVRETSPRLLDNSADVFLRTSDDYAIYKARGEDFIRSLPQKNWTIIRPAITYSLMRYQLVTLEAFATVCRARAGKRVLLPETAKNVQGTMSWAGDVAEMIARLLFNEKALGDTFTVSTAEHHTWGEIADYYKDICGLDAVWIDQQDFLKVAVNDFERFPYSSSWQLRYDRLFDRIMDNSRILAVTGLQQSDLKPLYDGLSYEIGRCPESFIRAAENDPAGLRMDRYLQENGLL